MQPLTTFIWTAEYMCSPSTGVFLCEKALIQFAPQTNSCPSVNMDFCCIHTRLAMPKNLRFFRNFPTDCLAACRSKILTRHALSTCYYLSKIQTRYVFNLWTRLRESRPQFHLIVIDAIAGLPLLSVSRMRTSFKSAISSPLFTPHFNPTTVIDCNRCAPMRNCSAPRSPAAAATILFSARQRSRLEGERERGREGSSLSRSLCLGNLRDATGIGNASHPACKVHG